MEIVKGKLDMCETLAKLKFSVWNTTYRGIYPESKFTDYDLEKQTEKFKSYVNDNDVNFVVGIEDGKIVGYMSVGKTQTPYLNYENEIILLYILKDYQGQGFGRQFFEFGYNDLKKKGVREFVISCNKFNSNALKFYEKMGGKIIHIDDDNPDKSLCQTKFLYKID